MAGICRSYHESSDCFEYPKNPFLNQATRKKDTCQNFATQNNPEIENFTPKNSSGPSLSLEIRSTPPGGGAAVWNVEPF